jgi:nitrile hydratase
VDGIHDLGGMDGFGPVRIERGEPVFHHGWERRALGVAMSAFAMGLSNGGEFRHSIERMDPIHYLGSSYYEHWITGRRRS